MPELIGVPHQLRSMMSEEDYFASNLILSTLDDPPRERDYTMMYNPVLFEDPPSWAAVEAIVLHEFKHTIDYTMMNGQELAEFGVWYANGDISEYEHETDEFALELGFAEGLKAYRLWLYDHVSPETAEQKRYDYYTPEEIDAWVEENG